MRKEIKNTCVLSTILGGAMAICALMLSGVWWIGLGGITLWVLVPWVAIGLEQHHLPSRSRSILIMLLGGTGFMSSAFGIQMLKWPSLMFITFICGAVMALVITNIFLTRPPDYLFE